MASAWAESAPRSSSGAVALPAPPGYSGRGMSNDRQRGARYIWGIVWRTALALALIPIVLIPVYRFVPPVSTLMVWEGATRPGSVERTWLPLDAMSPALVTAVMMSEDGRYCSHNGVDWQELNKVIERSEDRPRGASTIAMQSVKNLFFWPSRSYLRKAVEIPLALYADFIWGKRREMEIYLNVVEWGPGIFGAEAAARHYFHRSARDLTAGQAALLAVALPNPILRNPADPGPGLRELAANVAARARTAGGYVDCLSARARL
jgi:monofunctional biosynthetic peptidoglycan transglycosylase